MVDPRLAAIIARVESGGSGDASAIRFEPFVYAGWHYDQAMSAARRFNQCSIETAKAICATSWGRYQELGYNLYLDGYTGPVVSFAAYPVNQDKALDVFLTKRGINWTWAELKADEAKARSLVDHYNGPAGWPVYWQRMLQADGELPATSAPVAP